VILCQSAEQTINIYYSVIKFAKFEGFSWSGDSLPFRMEPLGDLQQVQLSLFENGEKLKGVVWQQGMLYAPFKRNRKYDLSMRLEYRPPYTMEVMRADFSSIQPQRYALAVDFGTNNFLRHDPEISLTIGDAVYSYPLEPKDTHDLPTGEQVKFTRQKDYCSIQVHHGSDVPYGIRDFPEVRL
jgi:hypothetical protein